MMAARGWPADRAGWPSHRSQRAACVMFFISSAFNDPVLRDIREGIHDWAGNVGIPVWLFEKEKNKEEWGRLGIRASLSTCLTALANSEAYVGIVHDAYGSSASSHVASVAFTDLEAFHAIRLKKPMLLYVVESSCRTADTDALLTILKEVVPQSFKGEGTKTEVLAWVKRDMADFSKGTRIVVTPRTGRFLDATSRSRWNLLTSTAGLLVAPEDIEADAETVNIVVKELVRWMSTRVQTDPAAEEVQLSRVLQQVLAVPWRNPTCVEGRRVWDEFCQRWRDATIWHDNHHYGRLGCLATTNMQLFVRCLEAMCDEILRLEPLPLLEANAGMGSTEWYRVYELGGTLGSAYYSLGKVAAGRRRDYLLYEAGRWVHVAKKIEASRPENFGAGLAAILGHIHLAAGMPCEAEGEFRRSLALREARGDDRASIAEAKGDLGHLLFRNGNKTKGLQMLQESAATLCECASRAFAARIKLKLADAYLRKGRIADAVGEVREGDAICRGESATLREPAGRGARVVLRMLRVLASRRPLKVAIGRNGYTFAE